MSDSEDGGGGAPKTAAAAAPPGNTATVAPSPPPPPPSLSKHPKHTHSNHQQAAAMSESLTAGADLPALFWDTMPDDAEAHPDFLALQALAEESTPEERAENFKVQGNNKVKVGLAAKNRHVLREAVDFYGKGIALRCADADINGMLLSNRAHVQLLLGNWRHALRDAEAAARLRPADPKARHRAARAALELGELARAAALLRGCGVGVERGTGEGEEEEEGGVVVAAEAAATAATAAAAAATAGGRAKGAAAAAAKSKSKSKTPPPRAIAPLAPLPPLPPLDDATRADFDALARRLLERRLSLRRERERERAARERALKPARELACAVLERGLRLAAPAVNRVGSKSARPRLCPETGGLRWPVVFMYPEAPHAPDVVEDAGEDDLIADHLDVMFADDAPPLEWEREAAAAAAATGDGGSGGGGNGGNGGGNTTAALAASRYTRSAVELYYVAGAGRPLVGESAPLEEQEEALAHALHWGWPEEEEEKGEEEEDEDDDDKNGPGALARREGGGGGRRKGKSAAAPPAKPRFARLDAEALTIGEALRLPGHVVAGVPVFWVVARGTEYHARWLREAPIV